MSEKLTNKLTPRKPRKIRVIRPSKYEFSGAVQANRKYWNDFLKDPCDSDQPIDSHVLMKVLPPNLHEKVCRLLKLSTTLEPQKLASKKAEKPVSQVLVKDPMLMTRRQIHVERELDSDTDVELDSGSESDEEQPSTNVHLNLLMKPEREQITWNSQYLQPEEEHEKNLTRKADDLTNKIAEEFCTYMRELGGNQQSQLFTPETIKELFQIEFNTHIARGLQIVPKELPVVEESLAIITGNPGHSKYAALERLISEDIEAEKKSDLIHAFGRHFDQKDQRRAPKNDTKNTWRSARHVPKDLITLKTVWEGITNLKSVKEYCRWMIEHPEYEQPLYLKSLGMFDPAVLQAKLAIEEDQFTARNTRAN